MRSFVNPDIANTFFRAGLIESWGRGIEKMENECRAHGLPAPEIQYSTSFMLSMDASALLKEVRNGIEKENVGKTSGKTSGKASGKAPGKRRGNEGETSEKHRGRF